MASISDQFPAGVLVGDDVRRLFELAQDQGFAIPAFNVVSSSSANAVLEAARDSKNPCIIQVSNGGATFYAGKGCTSEETKPAVAGAIAMGLHVRTMAKHYGVPVVLHSDHCAKKLLWWFDGMLKADEEYFAEHGEPLYSSHMLDLSEENDEENIETCVRYFKRMAVMNQWLEMEIGITGGVEDGVDNTSVDNSKLYTTKEQVFAVHQALAPISPNFSIAAAFGNVHGVYKPGNVKLSPHLLKDHQVYARSQIGSGARALPLFLVFHGGSGSTEAEVKVAVGNGVVKMNIDTDTQWAYWNGVRKYYAANEAYLQGQIGNPDGADKPNKKKYDPRVWTRKAEQSMGERVQQAYKWLQCDKVLGDDMGLVREVQPTAAKASSSSAGGFCARSAILGVAVGALAGILISRNMSSN
jgi:fructose-bisphosphate aldolase class II